LDSIRHFSTKAHVLELFSLLGVQHDGAEHTASYSPFRRLLVLFLEVFGNFEHTGGDVESVYFDVFSL
jgi:hypothetical protein